MKNIHRTSENGQGTSREMIPRLAGQTSMNSPREMERAGELGLPPERFMKCSMNKKEKIKNQPIKFNQMKTNNPMKSNNHFLKWMGILLLVFIAGTMGVKAQVGALDQTGAQTVCLGMTEDYGVPETIGSTYAWSITPSTGGTITGNTNVIKVKWTSTGDYTLQVIETNNSGCEGEPTTILVTVNLLPTATIGGTLTVCKDGTSPDVTFTGADGLAPYTFSYTLDGVSQTVTTTTGNSVTVSAPTTVAGVFTYELVSVQDASGIACSQAQTGTAVITVNPLPTATIGGTLAVCKDGTSPDVTFTGADGTAPYTFTYTLDGVSQTVSTTTGNSVTVSAPTTTAGVFTYELVSVQDAGATTCSQAQTGTAVITVNPLPTATIGGTLAVCKDGTAPDVTFTGADGTAPYTFTYTLDGVSQTVTTTTGNSVTVSAPTTAAGVFTYELVSVQDAGATTCSQAQTGTAVITVNPLPTATIGGTLAVCEGGTAPDVTFTGADGIAPYTFTYTIDGVNQTVTTTTGNSVTVSVPTTTAGVFTYELVSVKDASGTNCSEPQTGTAVITVHPLPVITLVGPSPICESKTGSVYTTEALMSNYVWVVSPGGSIDTGGTSTDNTVTVTWNVAGPQTVSVNYENANGCSALTPTVTNVTVSPLPATLTIFHK